MNGQAQWFGKANNAWSYGFVTSDVNDAPGLPGQGTQNPKADFARHDIVFIDGRFYDPSYGVDFATLSEWEAHSVAAFGKVTLKNNNAAVDWEMRKNETHPWLPVHEVRASYVNYGGYKVGFTS